MSGPQSTCWTLIHAAAVGGADERDDFARRYASVLRAYFAARWRGSPLLRDRDDAVQDVFIECFRPQGLLDRADPCRPGGFRAFLYGAARNIARRREQRPGRDHQAPAEFNLEQIPDDDPSQSRAFDRAWAKAILREAGRLQEELGRDDLAASRRVELLRLRFHDELPIWEIAQRWQLDAALVHREYAKARDEFRAALAEVVAFHHPGTPAQIDEECRNLLSLLG